MEQKKYKQNLLDALYEQHKQCTQCPLSAQGRKNIVFGEGSPDAHIMFVGEGPGRDEDILCRPFVGRSGKLLDKILELAELNRKEVFIANVVKCRPPGNRKPLPIESKTCKQLLLFQQIKIIRPKIVCTLGASALEALIDKPVKITQLRGKAIKHNGLIIFPTYHPAYILRNNNELETFTNDIKTAKLLSKSPTN